MSHWQGQLPNEYFNFWYFKYILLLIFLYVYLSKILDARLTYTGIILPWGIASFTQVKALNNFSITDCIHEKLIQKLKLNGF